MRPAGEITHLSAAEMARLIREKSLGPVEVVRAHLAAIERLNPRINAVCTVAADFALEEARRLEQAGARREPLGPLAGVPVGIKDITVTAGIRTTFGSPLYKDFVPRQDAEVVTRLKKAGAVVIGKTNTPEFAAGANTVNAVFGATRNPWDPRMSAAGSTGGGAAALACGMIALAEGSDFGGSLRTPAAFCGLVGLRTTAGLVPRHPFTLPWHDMSVAGPMARTAEDCALLLDSMIGFTRKSPLSCVPPWTSAHAALAGSESLKGVRIAWVSDIAGIGFDSEVGRICRTAAMGLALRGAEVEEIEFDVSDGRESFLALRGEAMVGNHLDKLDRMNQLGANLSGNIRAGLALQILDIARAERKRAEIWHRFRELFEQHDLLLTPTAPVPPFPVERNYPDEINGRKLESYIDWAAPTFLVSLAGLPAASVPAGLTLAKLPVGLQIIGPRFSEPEILSAAKFVAQGHPIGWAPNS